MGIPFYLVIESTSLDFKNNYLEINFNIYLIKELFIQKYNHYFIIFSKHRRRQKFNLT